MTSSFDRRIAARAAAYGALAFALAILVVAATDPLSSWRQRVGLAGALLPAAGAVGAFVAIARAKGLGEVRALGALGVSATRVAAGAVVGGALVGLGAPAIASSGLVDLGALFPRAEGVTAWSVDGDGLRAPDLGVRVGPRGAVSIEPRAPSRADVPPDALAAVVAALALAALALPASAAPPTADRTSAAVVAIAVVAAIATFQAAAARVVSPAWLVAAPLALLVHACLGLRRARSSAA